jgi:hypothetical protein
MAKKLEGWKKGQGVYSQVSDGKDKIVQGTYKDRVSGDDPDTYELDIEKIHDHSAIGLGSATGGASRKLPKDMR